jgi:hydroxyacylglutathione hydrolase
MEGNTMKKIFGILLSAIILLCTSVFLISCGNSGAKTVAVNEALKIIELPNVNAYLVKTKDGFLLIDTGYPNQWNMLESQLKAAGCLPGTLRLVILTHGDFDHSGNCAKLQEVYKVKIAMDKGDADMVEKGMRRNRQIRTLMGRFIMVMSRLKGTSKKFVPFKPDLFVTDGQDLKPYGFDAKIVHVPGHTSGSIGILTAKGDLFIGDTVFNISKPEYSIFIENDKELKASFEKLKELKAKMVYPGHGKPFPMEEILKIKQS